MTNETQPSQIDPTSCPPGTTHAIAPEAANTLAATLKALADPLRLRMLSAIATDTRGETCVCDLAELADVSQPTVSHHLKVLKEVGLLISERRATWVWYRIAPEMRAAVGTLLGSFAPAAYPSVGGRPEPRGAHPVNVEHELGRIAERLAARFGSQPEEAVLGIVRDSYAALARTATVRTELIPLTERFADQRLTDLGRDRAGAVPQVLFVCVANAGRSQLAAALVQRYAGDRVIARSAGSAPAEDLHPNVRPLLEQLPGTDLEAAFPKPLTDDAVRASDVVVTMGCGDVCPVLPGIRYEDWAVGDPALATGEGAAAIRDEIAGRVRHLLRDLVPDLDLDENGASQ